MFKIISFFLLSISILFSQEIHFKETKYIYALDNELSKMGTLNITDNKVILQYESSDKTVIYTTRNIEIVSGYDKKIYTHEESIEYELFFKLVLAIYKNDTTLLLENFTIIQKNNTVNLLPNEYLASVLKTIQYEKDGKKLKYLKIDFTNQDRITIAEIQ